MDEHQGGRNRKGPFLSVVSVDDIPKANPTPCDNLVDVYRFCLELRSLCEKLHGTGLSAVQVGVPWDLFVIRGLPKSLQIAGESCGYFVGCGYEVGGSDSGVVIESIEACLSLRNNGDEFRTFRTRRPAIVHVQGYRLIDANGLQLVKFDRVLDQASMSIAFQHEIDHCQGITLRDSGTEVLLW